MSVTADDRAVRWLDGTNARLVVLQFAHDHHAFHEDAKPGDLSLQLLPIRWRSSSNQFMTTTTSFATGPEPPVTSRRILRNRLPSG